MTCRKRKIKCDEAKPVCTKCSSTGRKCDGYTLPSTSFVAHPGTAPQPGSEAILASSSQGKLSNELRALEFFWTKTGPALCSTFDSDFWTATVFRLAIVDPMIRHSVIALSSIHEAFELSLLPFPDQEQISQSRRQTLLHYIETTNRMQQHLSNINACSPTLLLVASICLICLELFQDNYLAAISHFEGGLRILAMFNRNQNSEALSLNADTLEETIKRPVTRLLVQSLYLQVVGYHISLIPDFTHQSEPTRFKTVTEAKDDLDSRSLSSYSFFWKLKNTSILPATVEDMYQIETSALSEWHCLFSEFLLDLGSHPNTRDWIGIQLINIQYHCLKTMLDLARQTHLGLQRTATATFTHILQLVQSLLEHSEEPPLPKYSFDSGVIGPLFYTAIRAPSLHLRDTAISLLRHRNIPYREGMWSSGMTAAMAEKIMSLQVEVIQSAVPNSLDKIQVMNVFPTELGTENILDTTWFNLNDLVDDMKKMKISVGRNDTGLMPDVLREDFVTWKTW